MSLIRIISILFFAIALGLAGFLAYRIWNKIEEDRRIDIQEKRVIDKLKMIRDAEVAYQAVNGKYTGSWDTLISFLDTGTLYLTQTTEEIFSLAYGVDSVKITIDTIGSVSVKDSIFRVKDPVFSLVKGTVNELLVSTGDRVKKGDVLFSVDNEKGKTLKMKAPVSATIQTIKAKPGDRIEDIQTEVVTINYPRIDDIKNLPYLPNSTNRKFELFAGKIVRGNLVMSVFEAKDTNPINPTRKLKGEENPLKVGSRTDVSTSGNWEF